MTTNNLIELYNIINSDETPELQNDILIIKKQIIKHLIQQLNIK